MHHRALFYTQAIILLIVGATHVAALQWSLYWHFLWLDIPVHFLSGAWVALAAAWFLDWQKYPIGVFRALSIVLVFGAAWELFEITAGVPLEVNYAFDTTLDLLMDIAGGACGFFAAQRMLQSANNAEIQNNPS